MTPSGVVTTIAGSARLSGSDDGFGSQGRFRYPFDVTVDSTGNIFVADTENHTIRRITPEGRVTTVAGKASEDLLFDEPNSPGSEDGVGGAARFEYPWSIDVDAAGTLWVTDTWNHTIRRITPAFEVTTVAGRADFPGRNNANGASARFYAPSGIAVAAGGFYIADRFNHTIRFMTPNFDVPTLAGSSPEWGVANGPAASARFFYPAGAAVDPAGNVYISELSDTIRKITPGGVVTSLAGMTDEEGSADGTGSAARFDSPQGLAADAQGNVYVADSFNCTIRKITPAGVVTTLAGTVGVADFRNGTGTQARFDEPQDVAVDSLGNVYVADTFNHVIRIIEPSGLVSTFAGFGVPGSSNGVGEDATFSYPSGVAVDAARNIYVADRGNNMIRKITQAGVVTTVAGSTQAGHVDAKGTAARFTDPAWIAATPDGTLYVTEWDKHSIRRIDPDGNVTTTAGVASYITAGNVDGTGSGARFFYPHEVAAGVDGRVYIADQYNHNVRVGTLAAPQVTSFTATPGSIDEGGSATLAWTTTDATSVTISGIGAVAASGTVVVTPSVTTTYTLTAVGPGGTVTQTVTVRVGVPGRRRSVRH
jgi:streptogramin lyase